MASGTTLGSVSAVTGGAPNLDFTITGGSCGSGTTNTICTVAVQFLPTASGIRLGALVFNDQSGNTLLSVSTYGTGNGPVVAFGPGTITSLAGGHGQGYSGDTGQATAAQLGYPNGVTVDGSGNVFIADSNNNVVRKVTPGGIITTVAGGGSGCGEETDGFGDGCPGTSASLNYPATVRTDGAGNVYIADYYNNLVRKLSPAGIITLVAGGGTGCGEETDGLGDGCPATSAILNGPWGTASDAAGNLYIGDSGNNLVRKVALDGTITIYAGTGAAGYGGDGMDATSALLNAPQVGAVDGAGNLYFADYYNNVIRAVTPGGVIMTVAGNNGLGAGYTGDGGPATSAQLNYPQEVGVDQAGDLYIPDTNNSVIRKVTPGGTITTVVSKYGLGAGYSGDGGPATSAQINGPWDIAVDSWGNLYFPDVYNAAVRKVDVMDAPSLSFASTVYGATSAAQDVTVLNLGNTPLTISPITTSANFSLGGSDTSCNASSQVLASAASCVLGIEFAPEAVGSLAGSVTLNDNATPATQTIPLSGTGLAATPLLSVSCVEVVLDGKPHSCTGTATGIGGVTVSGTWSFNPASEIYPGSYPVTGTFTSSDPNYSSGTASGLLVIDSVPYLSGSTASFGNEGVNVPSAPKTIYLFNYSGGTITPVIPTSVGAFTIAAGSCGNPLTNHSACGFTVTFTPSTTGPTSATVNVQAGATTLPLVLTGTGVVPLYLSVSTAAYGNVGVGVASPPKRIYLFNYSGGMVTPVIPASVGAFTTSAGNCGNPVPNSSNCSFTVIFTPSGTGPTSGTLNVQVGATSLPVALTGTGVTPLYLNGSTAAFGNQGVNAPWPPKTIYLFNNTGSTISPVIPALTGVFTSAPGSCANPVGNGGACAFTVTFTPTTTGPATGTLNVQVGATILPLALTGTGVTPLYLSSSTADFRYEKVNVTSAPLRFYLYNYSGGTVSPSIPASVGAFATSAGSCGSPVPNNSTCNFTVTFTPSTTGPTTSTLNVQVGATTLPLVLTGTGN